MPRSIVAYDLGNSRPVWSALSEGGGTTAVEHATVVRDGVVISNNSVYLQGIDGSGATKLMDLQPGWDRFGYLAGSPDGDVLAVSVVLPPEPFGTPEPGGGQGYRRKGLVVFFDMTSRRELSIATGSTTVSVMESTLSEGPMIWRSDGTGIVLRSYTYSEGPGPTATVFIDGRVVQHQLQGYPYIAPDGQTVLHGIGSLGCMAIGDHQMYVRDLNTGMDVVQIHNSEREFTGEDWSPDGTEFLFDSRTYRPNPPCIFPREPAHQFLLSAETGLILPTPDLESLYRRWYGDELLWVECQDRFVPIASGNAGFPYAYCLDETSRNFVPGKLRYRDLEIDSANYFRIYAIVP